jgi:hypothetical protein
LSDDLLVNLGGWDAVSLSLVMIILAIVIRRDLVMSSIRDMDDVDACQCPHHDRNHLESYAVSVTISRISV